MYSKNWTFKRRKFSFLLNIGCIGIKIILYWLYHSKCRMSRLFLAKQHLKKDFPQRFLAKQLNIHGSHGEHGKDYSCDFHYDLHHRLFLSWLSIVKARSHYVFATPKIRASPMRSKINPSQKRGTRAHSRQDYS